MSQIRRFIRRAVKLLRPTSEDLVSALQPKLVVHVGASVGEEITDYEKLGVEQVVWIEADPETYDELVRRIQESQGNLQQTAIHALVGNSPGLLRKFYRYSNRVSSSVYLPKESWPQHLSEITPVGLPLKLPERTLDEVLEKSGIQVCDFPVSLLLLDVQGHELSVMSGTSQDLLECFTAILVEVDARGNLYDSGYSFEELQDHLGQRGYLRKSAYPTGHEMVFFEKSRP